jgi:hypothetical protein
VGFERGGSLLAGRRILPERFPRGFEHFKRITFDSRRGGIADALGFGLVSFSAAAVYGGGGNMLQKFGDVGTEFVSRKDVIFIGVHDVVQVSISKMLIETAFILPKVFISAKLFAVLLTKVGFHSLGYINNQICKFVRS